MESIRRGRVLFPLPTLWERQPHESAKAFGAFTLHRDMDASERSLAEVAQRLTVSKGTIACWSALYSWVARAEAWDDERDRLKRLSQIKAIEAMAERHAQQAQAIATVLMHWWKSKTIPHHWQPKSFE